jgi:hypothetical protein
VRDDFFFGCLLLEGFVSICVGFFAGLFFYVTFAKKNQGNEIETGISQMEEALGTDNI